MPPSPPKSSGNPSAAEGVAWRLSQLLRNPANQTVGRVHLVALDPARQHFGPEWPRVSEKVYDIVEGIFRESLITGEIYSRIDAMSYAIIPADKDENFSELIEAISEKIFTRVMGPGPVPKNSSLPA